MSLAFNIRPPCSSEWILSHSCLLPEEPKSIPQAVFTGDARKHSDFTPPLLPSPLVFTQHSLPDVAGGTLGARI